MKCYCFCSVTASAVKNDFFGSVPLNSLIQAVKRSLFKAKIFLQSFYDARITFCEHYAPNIMRYFLASERL